MITELALRDPDIKIDLFLNGQKKIGVKVKEAASYYNIEEGSGGKSLLFGKRGEKKVENYREIHEVFKERG